MIGREGGEATRSERGNTDADVVEVWIHGEGGWSLTPSIHYRIPTDIFDYQMMIGSLESKDDLEALADQMCTEEASSSRSKSEVSYTDIWVAGETWSGTPSSKYEVPSDVFEEILRGDCAKIFEKISSKSDLDDLVYQVRQNGAPSQQTDTISRAASTTEVKRCGHVCFISSVKEGCCRCSDRRAMREEGTYPQYQDGVGWVDNASRGSGYCPHCKY